MGRTSDEEGETSTKTCRSDDSSDRPLKKARYVWQIKGKYHLKKPENEEGAKLFIADKTKDGYKLRPIEVPHCATGSKNIDAESASGSSSTEIKKTESTRAITSSVKEIPSRMEKKYVNPWHLQKWQARQVARCFVDNTINKVLEDMGFIPFPGDTDDLMEDLTMSNLQRNDAHLEDAAVMMAIHSHGLQRAVAGIRNDSQQNEPHNPCFCGAVDRIKETWRKPELPDPISSASMEQSDLTKQNFLDSFMQEEFSLTSEWSQASMSSEDQTSDGIQMNVSKESRKDFKSDERDAVSEQHNEPMFDVDMSMSDEPQDNSSSFEHTDFLDKAVAVAIQKKGLSTLSGIEYG